MADITRDKFIPFIDTSETPGTGTYKWVPVDLSTVFELQYNPQTETYSYICYPNDTTLINSYQLSMEQEIRIDGSNPLYKWMLAFMRSMPTGSDAKRALMLVFPDPTTGEATDADLFTEGMIAPNTINTVDHILTFTLNFNGSRTEGTVAISDSTVTFTPADEAE